MTRNSKLKGNLLAFRGRNFAAIIHEFLSTCDALNNEFLPAYEQPKGLKAYEDTLNLLKNNFPQYVDELQGTADGAQVPFHKLFLLHMDNIILKAVEWEPNKQPKGCTTICVNQNGQEVMGHTEDALSETLNHFYFVSAHIISDQPLGRYNVVEEKFTSLCFAGHLPGFTMNYNCHGLAYAINTLSAKQLQPGKTPRHFLSRALLAAENFQQVQEILRDSDYGAADGCSVTLTFLNQLGDRLFHNIEMAPTNTANESELSVLTTSPNENLIHCNKYLRLKIEEDNCLMKKNSDEHMKVFEKYPKPVKKNDVIKMLSDESNKEFPVFGSIGYVQTIAVGIFDIIARTWSLYSDKPSDNEPLVVLPLQTDSNQV